MGPDSLDEENSVPCRPMPAGASDGGLGPNHSRMRSPAPRWERVPVRARRQEDARQWSVRRPWRASKMRGSMTANAVVMRRPIPAWAVPAGVAAAALLLFGPDLGFWWRVWRDPDSFYAHGPVVPVLVGILL